MILKWISRNNQQNTPSRKECSECSGSRGETMIHRACISKCIIQAQKCTFYSIFNGCWKGNVIKYVLKYILLDIKCCILATMTIKNLSLNPNFIWSELRTYVQLCLSALQMSGTLPSTGAGIWTVRTQQSSKT